MKEPYAVWPQMTVRQLPAGADHRCGPKLDLMPIRHPLDAEIRESHPNLFALAYMQGNAFIDDCGVALREKIILQCFGDELDKFDLTLHWESNVVIFDLPAGYASLRHRGRHIDACLSGTRAGKPR